MAVPSFIRPSVAREIKTIDMHTTGEPARIVYSGFPDITGTLLEQRATALAEHDHIRRSLMFEPRGHPDMYGAVLRPSTELVDAGAAHMGALFLTHEGYSTMCGHATIALARLLVDCDDPSIFPRRPDLPFDPATRTLELRLHVPCGLVRVTVPAVQTSSSSSSSSPSTPTTFRTDPSRPRITYLSVPSFALRPHSPPPCIPIPPSLRWPQLPAHTTRIASAALSYGGAFSLIVPAPALGFPATALTATSPSQIPALRRAATSLKRAFNADPALRRTLQSHLDPGVPAELQQSTVYSVFVTEPGAGRVLDGCAGAETGLCVFGDGQVDRSPTGSGVQARVALAVARGERRVGEGWAYHSLVSNGFGGGGEGGFVGRAVEEVEVEVGTAGGGGGEEGGREVVKGVRVEVSGWASYTGCHVFVVEEGDEIGAGFSFEALGG
ncbi:proline racemase [Diplodia corticola]|uniref:trans-L-3-hydroxyproline dehydratase n=1 Tax=Diplodia corticola TaxID=236234 RepID=A0A1J9R0C8_9PEZI|nr:proline racemase [Diplodia corticola]OJD34822.1 proline racemase [Diplodia corticola]